MLGEKSYGGTPRNIPNLEVKPVNAESTWREASWEDRNLPSFFITKIIFRDTKKILKKCLTKFKKYGNISKS